MKNSNHEWSYGKHMAKELLESKNDALPSCYAYPNSIDNWRHERIHRVLLPLIESYKGCNWITIGDGRYGSDAYFLKKNGVDVTATSLSDHTLAVANDRGYIDKFQSENAERISAEDNSFDFVFLKEAYHHFPRPPIAFYEMLRVAKKAVVMIEPNESRGRLLNHLKRVVKKIIRKDKTDIFEASGNYIFRLDINEMRKKMIALNYHLIAYRELNDFYQPSLATHDAAPGSWQFLLTRFGIAVQNILCKLKLMDSGLVAFIAFKTDPSIDTLENLRSSGFTVESLPINPFL